MHADPAGQRRHRFAQLLLGWYRREGRALPWRSTRDPYAILVSEIMLQQTQVSRVVPAYTAFLERYPTVTDLARAELADVLRAWRGLGYNRRARNVHLAAQAIVEQHGGSVPRDLTALRALPGVGDYTARAVLAFAFGDRVAPVDTNVSRVLARAVAGKSLGRAAGQRIADSLVPPGSAGPWSHALMDLGARICTARAPRCGACPVEAVCSWQGSGGSEVCDDPALATATRSRPQTTFSGSDRYHRGRLVDALRDGPLLASHLPRAAECSDATRLERLVTTLVADGLAEWRDERLMLPCANE